MRLKAMKKTNHLNFVNQHIYVGLDVHYKRWVVSIICNNLFLGSFSQDPDPMRLVNHLRKNYPGATYHCVYEAGFSGFWLYYALIENGVDCIVINPADVPTTHKEKDRKTDKIDSRKLCRCLSLGQLEGIYVYDRQQYEERSLVRARTALVQEQTRCKNRIKGLLKFFGIEITDENIKTHWSNKYLQYLDNLKTEYGWTKRALTLYLTQLRSYRKLISEVTKDIRNLSQTQRYQNDVTLLKRIPGISTLTAMILLTELGDIQRFRNVDKLCSYIGLIPSEHSSGESENRGKMTKRGKGILKAVIIESSWTAVRKDPKLLMYFNHLSKRVKKTRAIISVSRKLVARIMLVLKDKDQYEFQKAS